MPSIGVLDKDGVAQTVQTLPAVGSAADAASLPVTKSTEDKAVAAATKTAAETVAGAVDATKMKVKEADGDNATLGAKADEAATTDAGTFSVVALFKRLLTYLAGIVAGTTSLAVKTGRGRAVDTIVRPANTTPYLANRAVSTTAGEVLNFADLFAANGDSGDLIKVILATDQPTGVASYRLHLFHTAPTALADQASFAVLYTEIPNRVAVIELSAMQQAGGDSTANWSQWVGQIDVKAAAADTDLYGLLEITAGSTPASEQEYWIQVVVDRNA